MAASEKCKQKAKGELTISTLIENVLRISLRLAGNLILLWL